MKIYKEDNEAIPGIKVLPDADQAPAGFSEIVDIEEAHRYGIKKVSKGLAGWTDRLSFRSKMKQMIYTKMQIASPEDVNDQAKWDLLSPAEKVSLQIIS